MRRKLMSFLLAGLLIASVCIPASAAGTATVSGFYGIGSAANTTVTAAAYSGTVTPTTVSIGGKTVTVQNGSDQLKVSLSGASTTGQYLVLLTDDKGGSVPTTTSKILYIDQAPGSATVNFTVYPDLSGITAPQAMTLYITNNAGGGTVAVPVSYAPNASYPVPDYVLGDVNGDTAIDSQDALLILQYFASLVELTDTQKLSADVNSDGAVDSQDALLILQYFAGIISAF